MNNITVIGLGHVGLPMALVFADKGFKVTGVVRSKESADLLNSGKMPFIDEPSEVLLKKHMGKSIRVTNKVGEAVSDSEAIIITVGTPVDEYMNPIFSQIEGVFESIIPHLKKNQLIVLRSTVSPGVTEYLEGFIKKHCQFRVGKDIFLSYCPERAAEGKGVEETKSVPQIIGSLDDKSSELAKQIFEKVCDQVLLTDAKSAEIAKLACNTFRYIEFAIGNEMMMIADHYGRDIYEVLRLVNTDYVRGGLKSPGFSAGPCLFKDGFFLVDGIPYTELISTAWTINERVPAYLVGKIKETKNLRGAKVAILGLAFKKNVDDTRDSLSFKAAKIFRGEGAEVHKHDPLVKRDDVEELEEVLRNADVVMVATNHDYYKEYSLKRVNDLVKDDCLVCDIWNVWETGKTIFEIKGEVKK